MVLTTRFAGPGRVSSSEAAPRIQSGWGLEERSPARSHILSLAGTAAGYRRRLCASSSKRGYTITRILAGELECSSRCGKRDRRLAS